MILPSRRRATTFATILDAGPRVTYKGRRPSRRASPNNPCHDRAIFLTDDLRECEMPTGLNCEILSTDHL